jgi:hypothetical protein
MIQLMTVQGQSAKRLYLKPAQLSDFKSLLRSITSGRVMLVSTPFRSDLFYKARDKHYDAIIKLWALYSDTEVFDLNPKDFKYFKGVKSCLTHYFASIHRLSTHWYHYRQYRQAILSNYVNDNLNPLARTILECDRYLIQNKGVKRSPLLRLGDLCSIRLSRDHFNLAMRLMNNDIHVN